MTIRDLLDADIQIQNKVVVRLFVDDEEYDEKEITDERFYDLPESYLDKEIHYLRAIWIKRFIICMPLIALVL